MATPPLSIIICTFNRCVSLIKVLESVEKSLVPEGTQWEVLIVDNNSSDQTKQIVESFTGRNPGNFRYISEERQGKSFALNTGIREATGQILAFTDDDVVVDPNWIGSLLITFLEFDCIGVGGRIVPVWTTNKPKWYHTDDPYGLMAAIVSFDLGPSYRRIKTPPFGANMAFRRQAFERYGLFRTDLGPTVGNQIRGEDSEFCRRLMKADESLIYAPNAVVYHPVDKRRMKKSYFCSWYFDYGRACIKLGDIPQDTGCCFGIPRYLFRALGQNLLKWIFSLSSRARFYHKLQLCQTIGKIVETYKGPPPQR